jgi:lipid II:glycine glycyltransferase (peptidoglycan interpeptide bridge formation enzyme)
VSQSALQDGASVRVVSTNEPAVWRSHLPARRSVFGSVEFVSIIARHFGWDGRLLTSSSGSVAVACPFFLRPVADLPFAAASLFRDATSPEYTGPVATAEIDGLVSQTFRTAFAAFCRNERLVAAFAHLHPWNGATKLLEDTAVAADREIVYVDLTQSPEDLWNRSLTHACRKNLKRARREIVRVFEAHGAADIREFHRIYEATMRRTAAAAKYRFPPSFFLDLHAALPNHARFVLAEYRNRIVAGTLYLHDDANVYSYLGGADDQYQAVRPSNSVVFDTISWGRERGKQRLILGGGYRPDDGILRFKASFSPLRATLSLFKHVCHPVEYTRLNAAWAAYYRAAPDDTYFPPYRSLPRW